MFFLSCHLSDSKLNALCLALLGTLLNGCSHEHEKVATYTVEGRVVAGNKPVEFATVVLHPVDEFEGENLRPRGITDGQGKFVLTTYESGDGAPAGEYRLTIHKWTTDRPDAGPQNRLNRKYADPTSSGLKVSVQAGANNLNDVKIR